MPYTDTHTVGGIPFATLLRMNLAALNVSQRQLAARIGVTEWKLSKLLAREVSPRDRARLLAALHADTFAAAQFTVTPPASSEAVGV